MQVIVVKDYEEMSKRAATLVQAQMMWKPTSVLGLATGSTPIGLYKELVQLYNDKVINFDQITSFNLDEYLGLDKDNEQSYYHFMKENLFDLVNINDENIFIPDGQSSDFEKECLAYEKLIVNHGGIDLQILGIGHNGHIGFNEPNVNFEAKTHVVSLDNETIEANKRFFNAIEDVPKKAISMGIKTIMRSKRIILMASGEGKADIISQLVKDDIRPDIPASVLHLHENVIVLVDEDAASKL